MGTGRLNIQKWVCTFNAYLNTKGVNGSRLLRRLPPTVRNALVGPLAQDHPVLAEAHGLPMYIHPNTFETVAYLCQPFEPYTTELFEQAIRPAATVLDLGAQFGYFSLVAARRVGPEGRVYAFEPVPGNFELLERNIHMNGYRDIIHAVAKAVGDQHTVETMFVYQGSDSHSLYRHPAVAVRETTPVECVRIDEFLKGQPVDVIKMDIEGHEPFALEGMKQTIARSDHLRLFIELAPAYLRRAGVEPEDYLRQLEGLGFEIHLIDEDARRLHPLANTVPDVRNPTWHANLSCTKRR